MASGSSSSSANKILKRANPSTIHDKFLVGYQGWFTCAGDGPPVGPGHHGWLHWFNYPVPDGGHPNTDLWPDVSSYAPSELFAAPGLKYKNGEQAFLFSSRNAKTVQRHFHWMAEHGVDGAFLQRFAGQCDLEGGNEGIKKIRDEVGLRVREAAEREGRVFAIMYDVSGVPADRIQRILEQDWMELVRQQGVLDSPNYLREKGKPVVALWGFGFHNAGHTPALVRSIIQFFRTMTPGGAYIFGGAPASWRTAEGDSDRHPEFKDVWLNEFDAISPWTVGRYKDEQEADNFYETKMKGDYALIKSRNEETGKKVDYIPVVLPGGSGYNMTEGKWGFNDIKRLGGRFLWKQIFNAKRLGIRTMYGAMWDEYDEGTAFMPVTELKRNLPQSDKFNFLAFDADGYDVPSDWYMRICGFAAEGLRSERRVHETFPVKELQDYWSSRPKYEEVSLKAAEFVSGSSKDAGGGSSGDDTGDGQTYDEWLANQKDSKDEPPPPPYTLEDEPAAAPAASSNPSQPPAQAAVPPSSSASQPLPAQQASSIPPAHRQDGSDPSRSSAQPPSSQPPTLFAQSPGGSQSTPYGQVAGGHSYANASPYPGCQPGGSSPGASPHSYTPITSPQSGGGTFPGQQQPPQQYPPPQHQQPPRHNSISSLAQDVLSGQRPILSAQTPGGSQSTPYGQAAGDHSYANASPYPGYQSGVSGPGPSPHSYTPTTSPHSVGGTLQGQQQHPPQQYPPPQQQQPHRHDSVSSIAHDFGRTHISGPPSTYDAQPGSKPYGPSPPPVHPAHPTTQSRPTSNPNSLPQSQQGFHHRPPGGQPSHGNANVGAYPTMQWTPPGHSTPSNGPQPSNPAAPQNPGPYSTAQWPPPEWTQAGTGTESPSHHVGGANLSRPSTFTASSVNNTNTGGANVRPSATISGASATPTQKPPPRPSTASSHASTPTHGPSNYQPQSAISERPNSTYPAPEMANQGSSGAYGGPSYGSPYNPHQQGPPASSYSPPPPSGPGFPSIPSVSSYAPSPSGYPNPTGPSTYPGQAGGSSSYNNSYDWSGGQLPHVSPPQSPTQGGPTFPSQSSYSYSNNSPGQYNPGPSFSPTQGGPSYPGEHVGFPQTPGGYFGGSPSPPNTYPSTSYPGQHGSPNGPPDFLGGSSYPQPYMPSPGAGPWMPGGPSGGPSAFPPRPPTHPNNSYGTPGSGFPNAAPPAALNYALSAVGKVAGKKTEQQLGSLAQNAFTGSSKLYNKFMK